MLEAAEFALQSVDRRGDLVGRADPGAAHRDLLGGVCGSQPRDDLVVAGIIGRGHAVEPITSRVDKRFEISVDQGRRELARPLAILVAEHMEGDHDLAVAGMPRRLPGIAVRCEQRPHLLGDKGDRHHRIAHTPGKLERFRRVQRGDIERRPRQLCRPRQRGGVLDRMEAAAVADILLSQQQLDLLHSFPKSRHRLVGRDAKAAEFVRQERAREADIEAPAADRIEHRDFAGQLHRIVERRQYRAGDQPRLPRPLRRGGQEDDWVRAVAAIIMEVMLDDADMGEAEPVGLLGKVQRFPEIGFARFLLGLHIGEKLHAELHGRQDKAGRATLSRGCPARSKR